MFPIRVAPSWKVSKERLLRRKQLVQTARTGIVLRLLIIGIEIVGFCLWKSSSLCYDALASSFDVLSSFALILCIRIAAKPPDKEHPLGHGRFEPIAGLLIGLLLFVMGAFGGVQQIDSLLHPVPHPVSLQPIAWIVPLIAVLCLELAYRFLKKSAKAAGSPALEADAIHYRVDAIGSLIAFAALVMAAFFPSHSHLFDHLGAFSISLLMILVGSLASYRNIHQLLDRSPPDEYYALVREAALKVKGVLATEKVLLQVYGPDAHVAIDIEVDPQLSVVAAHRVTQQVRREIQNEWPSVRDVIVHVEPYYPGDH